MEHIKSTFAKCEQQKRAALVAYVTAGYPTIEETVDILLGLENGGAGTSTSTTQLFAPTAHLVSVAS
jgi:tryptophan synthase alpha subunit